MLQNAIVRNEAGAGNGGRIHQQFQIPFSLFFFILENMMEDSLVELRCQQSWSYLHFGLYAIHCISAENSKCPTRVHRIVTIDSGESTTGCKGPPLINDNERPTMVEYCRKLVDPVPPDCSETPCQL